MSNQQRLLVCEAGAAVGREWEAALGRSRRGLLPDRPVPPGAQGLARPLPPVAHRRETPRAGLPHPRPLPPRALRPGDRREGGPLPRPGTPAAPRPRARLLLGAAEMDLQFRRGNRHGVVYEELVGVEGGGRGVGGPNGGLARRPRWCVRTRPPPRGRGCRHLHPVRRAEWRRGARWSGRRAWRGRRARWEIRPPYRNNSLLVTLRKVFSFP